MDEASTRRRKSYGHHKVTECRKAFG